MKGSKPSPRSSCSTVAGGMELYRSERRSGGASAKMEGATARIWSSDKGRSERSTGEREAKRDVSCMVVSPDKEKEVCCSHRTEFLDSEPAFRLSGVVGAKNPVGLVAPSFLSSSPANTGRVPKGRPGS